MRRFERAKSGDMRRTKREPRDIDNRHTQVEVENWENDEYQASWVGQTSYLRRAAEALDSPSDLDWDGIENYGNDIEVRNYLVNRDGNCDYEEINDSAEIEVCEVAGQGFNPQLPGREGAHFRSFTRKNARGRGGDGGYQNSSRGVKTNFGKPIDREQNSEEFQARLAKVECVNLNGGFEQRRSGWGQPGNKPDCFECGNTDRFAAQFPTYPAKTKRWADTPPPSTKKGENERKAERMKKVRARQLCLLP